MSFVAAVSPFYAFQQSDPVGRVIVLVLFVASVFAWTIIIEKWLHLKAATRQIEQGFAALQRARQAGEVLVQAETLGGPLRTIVRGLVASLAESAHLPPEQYLLKLRGRQPIALSRRDGDRLKTTVESLVDEEALRLESRLGLLGSIVGLSPFLGLLGTVYGVMMAFTGMALVGRAEINAIAPGVSGALLTTVVGLLVAIPALLGYNLLVGKVRQLSIRLDNFASELLAWIQHDFQPEAKKG